MQRIALTVPRDIEAFLNQTIDRFSIGWYWTPPLCSVCGNEWLSRDCVHWPGRKYVVGCGDGGKREVLCELVFVAPAGKETSAVNAPAVGGTGVRGVLAELMAAKESLGDGRGMDEETEGQELRDRVRADGRGSEAGVPRELVVSERGRCGSRTSAAGTVAAVARRRRQWHAPAPGLDATLAVVQELADSAARGGAGQSAGRVRPARGAAGERARRCCRRAGGLGTWIA